MSARLIALCMGLALAGAALAKAAPFDGMDASVAPGDDFFAYANGGWLKTARSRPIARPMASAPSWSNSPTSAPTR